ncbi:TIGR01777 family oxidoreductase [Salinisphaera sp. Q1T1-3]|uniref:TIGR01777 family oxidoreductase n=1 Tax=Salinisphaera sp. Q1T1-3 TaxID=2321229 RepID=UPI000E72D88D|nr:TIGR01777 family oxidoreductase [Salinisphaera sp. Q1T1-3]RJS91314.1 TIGR01777 family protein [Salinisphaera sp. Q1T1-3]
MKKLLMTGGTGFVGRHLIPVLLDDGWQIEVLTRDADRARRVLPADVTPIETLDSATPPQAIVNLAGENLGDGRWTAARKQEMRDSRLSITRRLVAFIAGSSVKPAVLVSGSAVGYYGARGDEILDESSAANDEFQSKLCADWEAEALTAQDHGVRVCLVRTGVVLGANDGALAQMVTPFKFGLGGRFGSGDQYMPWIHIDDEVGAIRFLLSNESASGPFNLTAPAPVTNRVFTKTLGRVLNRPAIAWIPGPALKLAVGEMARLLLTGQRAVPKALDGAGYSFRYTQLEPALADLLG